MKKTHNVLGGKRKNASVRRKAFALTLCVSLWLAGGAGSRGRRRFISTQTKPYMKKEAPRPLCLSIMANI